jgi:hypothetical protein
MMEPTQSFFYLRANGRKRKKHIQILQTLQGLAITHDDKEREIACHFEELLETKHYRAFSLNWEELNYPAFNLTELEANISGEEVKSAILEMPKRMLLDLTVL